MFSYVKHFDEFLKVHSTIFIFVQVFDERPDLVSPDIVAIVPQTVKQLFLWKYPVSITIHISERSP